MSVTLRHYILVPTPIYCRVEGTTAPSLNCAVCVRRHLSECDTLPVLVYTMPLLSMLKVRLYTADAERSSLQ